MNYELKIMNYYYLCSDFHKNRIADMLKAAFFDLDGVVFDTEPLYTKFWEQQGQLLPLPIDNFAKIIKGMTLVEIFQKYFPDERQQQQIRSNVENYEREMEYRYVPGCKRILEQLRASEVKLAIVTSSDAKKMSNVYRQHPNLTTLFDLILTSEDFDQGKPAPDCYLSALQVVEPVCIRKVDAAFGSEPLEPVYALRHLLGSKVCTTAKVFDYLALLVHLLHLKEVLVAQPLIVVYLRYVQRTAVLHSKHLKQQVEVTVLAQRPQWSLLLQFHQHTFLNESIEAKKHFPHLILIAQVVCHN